MNKPKIVDLHCDTIWCMMKDPEIHLADADLSINIGKLREGGSLAQSFALYVPWVNTGKPPYELLLTLHDIFLKEMEANKDNIRQARTYDEILQNEKDGYLTAFLTTEEGAYIENDLSRIDEVYDWGVRMIGLIWNGENTLAYPNSADDNMHKLGLKPFGKDAVAHMAELGIIVDTSHLNEGGFYDVADIVKGPFVASHSCARSLSNHERNLTDDQIKTLANHGGVAGVNFCGEFLFDGIPDASPTIDKVIEHMQYMKNLGGIEVVALGSDFDGISDNGEIVDFTGFTRLVERMENFFTADEIDKITHKNALRVIKDVVGSN